MPTLTATPKVQLAAAIAASRNIRRRNKFGAIRTKVDGIVFDSRKEAGRWAHLLLLQRAGVIDQLQRQVKFEFCINGVKVGSYVADFQYVERKTGRLVVEDVKSRPTRTRDFEMKRKLMLALHGIEVLII